MYFAVVDWILMSERQCIWCSTDPPSGVMW